MPEMTLTEAAKWTGKGRSTIFKAIKQGRLSAARNDKGEFRIEPGELERVFKMVDTDDMHRNSSSEQPASTGEMAALRRENALLQETLTDQRATISDLRGERDRLLGIVENQGRILAAQPPSARPSWWRRFTSQ